LNWKGWENIFEGSGYKGKSGSSLSLLMWRDSIWKVWSAIETILVESEDGDGCIVLWVEATSPALNVEKLQGV
jgi:hypothetical protein